MINKIFKIINNKFSRFFKFVFFLRYLFAIFFVSIALFLYIPQFFDYKKKEKIIKNNLSQSYGIEIYQMDNIKFYSFPTPRLKIRNLSGVFLSKNANIRSDTLVIYPDLLGMYNIENFGLRKIKLENSKVEIDTKNIKLFLQNFTKLKKKIFLENLNLKIKSKNIEIMNVQKIEYLNYGYKKNKISGEIFGRKFIVNLEKNLSKINFKLLETGVSASLNIFKTNQSSMLNGNLKGKVLKSNFKLNFLLDEDLIKITNFFFRDKRLSLNSEGEMIINPFFQVNLISTIKDIDTKILKYLDIYKLLEFKNVIKKLNSENNFIFKSNRFSRNLISDLNIKTILTYGTLIILKNIEISDSKINCKNMVNLLEDYPILNFDCLIDSKDKKKFLKNLSVEYNVKNQPLKIKFKGNLNILSNKINFDFIKINDNDTVNKDDLNYYKNNFEKILFNKDFTDIFNMNKIKKFILEIS